MSATLKDNKMASIRKLTTGKYQVQIFRGGKRYAKNFASKKQAEEWAYLEEGQYLEKKMQYRGKDKVHISGHTLFRRFRDEVCPVRNRGGKWEKYKISYWLNYEPFGELITNDPEVYKKLIRTYCEKRLKDGKTRNTVRRELTLLSTIFTYAMKHWDLPILDNPVRRVPRPQADDKPRKERWPDSDVDKIYKAVGFKYGNKPTEMRHRICYALSLAVETAMRCGEICMVTKNDYGYEVDEKGNERHYLYLATTKNGEERYVPLSSKAKRIVDILVSDLKDTEHLMLGRNADQVSALFRKMKKKAKLDHKRFHDSRHEATTRLAKRIPNVVVLSAITGHKELKMLKRYYNPTVTESGSYLN